MARKPSTAKSVLPPNTLAPQTLILDNGAHTIKGGFSSATSKQETHEPDLDNDCQIIANCIARSTRDKRSYVGPELLDECWDFGELAFRRPIERGFVVNWEGEKAIWERSFLDDRARLKVRYLVCCCAKALS
jgi:actin-related protein 6